MTAAMTPRAIAKRAQIRAAAQTLFLQHGFAATTMDAITASAGISKQTLYRYYVNKEALFADILDQLTLQRETTPPSKWEVATRADFEAALAWLARDIIGDIMRPTLIALMRVMIAETPRFPHLKELFRTTVSAPGLTAIARLIDEARAVGVVTVPETEAAVRLFIGPLLTYQMIDGFFAIEPPHAPPEEEVAAIVRLFVRAVT